MLGRERIVVGGLLLITLMAWLGFLLHDDPRFPGSLLGSFVGVIAAILMIIPLAYGVIKRVPPLRRWAGRVLGMRRLIVWHIYAGLVGAGLALVHSAHRFESIVGIALIALILLSLLSGYVGRHLIGQVARDLREKQVDLAALRIEYTNLARQACQCAAPTGAVAAFLTLTGQGEVGRIASVAGAIADVERSIESHDRVRTWLGFWLWVHIATSYAAFALIAAHLAIEIYLGFRWL